MSTEKVMSTKTCPVCGLEQDKAILECSRCGWDYPLTLGTQVQVESLLRERLERALTAWQQRRHNPDLAPELERDPFETLEEFDARLVARPWYLGEGALRKAEYDMTTGRFPLIIQSPRAWAVPLIRSGGSYSLRLSRDPARELYQRGAAWPLYARLGLDKNQVTLATLSLVTSDGELPVEIDATRTPSGAVEDSVRPMINGRYRDLGHGTLVDTQTGLQWMRCAHGQRWDGQTCVGAAHLNTWKEQFNVLIELNRSGGFAGHADWRLPTIEELKTLILDSRTPAIDLEAFPMEPNSSRLVYWSSSQNIGYPGYAWYIQFYDGYVGNHAVGYQKFIRLVRGGR